MSEIDWIVTNVVCKIKHPFPILTYNEENTTTVLVALAPRYSLTWIKDWCHEWRNQMIKFKGWTLVRLCLCVRALTVAEDFQSKQQSLINVSAVIRPGPQYVLWRRFQAGLAVNRVCTCDVPQISNHIDILICTESIHAETTYLDTIWHERRYFWRQRLYS